MEFVFDDGGRKEAGFKGETGDCVTRAIAIATGQSYKTVYDNINLLAKGSKRKQSARTGIYKDLYRDYLEKLGWVWVPIMKIGIGCTVHLRSTELPSGMLIIKLSKHLTVVKDGVLHDIYDCSRGGTRCVYGYWYKS